MRYCACRSLVVVLSTLALALSIAACGSDSASGGDPPPSASGSGSASAGATTSASGSASEGSATGIIRLEDLKDCADVRASHHGEAVLTVGETDESKYGDGDAPSSTAAKTAVRKAIGVGGWLRLTYHPEDSDTEARVGAMDVLDYGSVALAAAAKASTIAGKDEYGTSLAKYNRAIQAANLILVYTRTYEDDGTKGIVAGVIATAQACLGKLGSSIKLPEPKRIVTEPVE